jgi:hypothetical protein
MSEAVVEYVYFYRSPMELDDLLKQQRDLLLEMDQHHQRKVSVLQGRIARLSDPNSLPALDPALRRDATQDASQSQTSNSLPKLG